MTVKVFSPLVHLGLPVTLGSGIYKDPINLPLLSETKRIFEIVATAPEVFPISFIFGAISP